MQITFDCPKCLCHGGCEVTSASTVVKCPDCEWSRSISAADFHEQLPGNCLVCGCTDLWRQKDFSPRVGVAIVALGVLLSTIAMIYMQPELSLGILMVFALADMVLYSVMRDCLVCYRCHARYRRVPGIEQTGTFDLEVNERYRQEAIRLKQADPSASAR